MSIGIAIVGLMAVAGPIAEAAGAPAVTDYPSAFFNASQPNTAFDMIVRLPGFSLDTGAAVRGFGGAAGNVLVDGARPTAKDDPLDEILRRIPASSVLKIELIRGGAPGIDMQGKTLLANIVRRRKSGLQLTFSVSGTRWYDGRYGRDARLEFSKQAGETRYEGSLLVDRGIDDQAGNGVRTVRGAAHAITQSYTEHNAGDLTAYKATGAVETPAWGGKARLNLSFESSPYRLVQDDRSLISTVSDTTDLFDEAKKTLELGLRYDHALGSRAGVEALFLQQWGRDRQIDNFDATSASQRFHLAKRTGESIARVTFKFDPTPAISVRTGIETDYNRLSARTLYRVNGAAQFVPAANVWVTEKRGEGFFSATWRATPSVALEAGLRVEASKIAATGDVMSGRTFVYPKPRAVVTWSPDGADQIRLRVEREVGQLNFDDFAAGQAALSNSAVHVGNPNINPQKAWVFEGAFERKMWGSADATVTFRHAILSDVIDRAPIDAPTGIFDAPGNIGGGRKDEVALSVTLPTDKLGVPRGLITGTATWRWSSVTDPTTGSPRTISGLHPFDSELHVSQGLPKLKTTWGVDVYGQWRETYYRFNEIDTDKKKIYVSLFADYKPRPDTSLRIELENASGRGLSHGRELYPTVRGLGDAPSSDLRTLHSGRGIYVRIRKTFG